MLGCQVLAGITTQVMLVVSIISAFDEGVRQTACSTTVYEEKDIISSLSLDLPKSNESSSGLWYAETILVVTCL
jgi:hypothetical protein